MADFTKRTTRLTLGGILGAIAVICLLMAVILPTNRLSFYALSSFFCAVVIIESGIKTGWLFFAATSLLAVIIIPEKIGIVPYVVFFGLYGIIKLYIERINKLAIEYILKFVYFNICLVIAILFIKQFLVLNIMLPIPWWSVVLLFEVIFLVYDYVYTLFIAYYKNKLRAMLKIK